jgi:pyruvate/2-oxoglutarate dehydrogenase complex dihydrolipoamide dehydrogenase (E3) component
VLCEKSERLGGVLRCEDGVDFKRNLSAFLDNQERAVLAAGIDVRLETPATPQLAGEIAPEAIIAAVGARPVTPKIPGIEHAVGAERVYLDVGLAGESAVILGGGLVGAELAIHLARLGRKVTLVEMLGGINDGGNMLQGLAIRLELARLGITALFDTRAIEILPGAVKAGNATGSFILTAQTTIYAVGQAPRDESAEALRFLAPEFHRIGDCLAPKNIAQATRMGYNIAAAL